MTSTQPHALYRFYSATGQLLYIGITHNPGARFQQHQQDKPWWHEVAGISLETFPTREEVLAAERRAIEVERPTYNIQRPTLAAKQPTGQHATVGLVWPCHGCHKPVADGTGYLHVSMADVAAVEAAQRTWDEHWGDATGLDTQALLDLPDTAHWRTHHAACDPNPDSSDYWFGVERARTHAHLLQRTAHLMEKAWLDATDWDDLIERAAGVND